MPTMPLSNEELLDALNTVISIPPIPFTAEGAIDYEGHGKNIDYLLASNHLEGDRRRALCIAGTSLIHHIAIDDQLRLMEFTTDRMAGKGIFISGVAPNPLADAERLIEAQTHFTHPPDCFLLMPLSGVADPDGMYHSYMSLGERLGPAGVRFLYYLRQERETETAVRLVNDSSQFLGVKAGTVPDDVKGIVDHIRPGAGTVIWGVGDRSTAPAAIGAKGHTSGINIGFAKASDLINNAQRRGDYDESNRIEALIAPLEEIRFRNARQYNYSAVVEALHLGGWDDVEGGTGGPFNPRVPEAVREEVRAAIEPILSYH
jgi:dihydrodipicolinate synthase/N-acetylneuraminate lyase